MSKELEALNKIDEVLCDIEIKHKENLGYTKPLTKTIEKSLKALEVFKEKCIDIDLLKPSKNWLDYYTRFKHRTGKNTEITQEEFELLRSVLE